MSSTDYGGDDVLVRTLFSYRGRSFPVGAFNKGLTKYKGVSLLFSKEYFVRMAFLRLELFALGEMGK